MTNDGQNTLVYDAENRVTSSTGPGSGTYTYDGNGLRVKKVSGSTSTVYAFSGAKVIAEYLNGAAPSSPSREYIYLGGALLASVAGGTGAVTYYHQDHLSNRLVTNSSGSATEQLGNFPFREWCYTATGEKWLFTSYERDSESNNDYALARYYVNRFGRFLSADPLSGSVADPQSLNRYAYVENNPINAADSSGLKMMPPLAWLGLQVFFGGFPTDDYNQASEFTIMAIPVVAGTYTTQSLIDGDIGPGTTTETIGNMQVTKTITDVTPDGNGNNWGTLTISITVLAAPIISVPTPIVIVDPPKMSALPWKQRILQRIQCAANYGDENSLASHMAGGGNAGNGGPPPNFAENLVGGNTASGILNIGLDVAGYRDPTAGKAATAVLSGGGQGLPGGGPGLKGATGVLQEAGLEAVGGQAAVEVGTGVGIFKIAYDIGMTFYGLVKGCN